MKIELSQSQIIALMIEKIGVKTTGTYNKADPTAYANGKAEFELMHGYNSDADPEVVKASFHDVTWGVSFEFATSIGTVEAYFDYQDKKWIRPTPSFQRVFKDVLFADPAGTAEANENADLMGAGIE